MSSTNTPPSEDQPPPPTVPSPPRQRPSRKGTRSPPLRRASLLTPSVSASIATTTTQHTYFLPSEGGSVSADQTTSSAPDPSSSALPSSSLSFPSTAPSTSEATVTVEPIMSDRERQDSDSSVKKRGGIFAPIRRLSTSTSNSDSGSVPAFASLLETQAKDDAARKAKTQKERSGDASGYNTAGSDSEGDAKPKIKRFGGLTRVLSAVRRPRKASDASTSEDPNARANSGDSTTQVSPRPSGESVPSTTVTTAVSETAAPQDPVVMSPVAEETSVAGTSPGKASDLEKTAELVVPAPEEGAVDLGSPPASPIAETAPIVMAPMALPAPEVAAPAPAEVPAAIEESGVLVPEASAISLDENGDSKSADTKMTPVSSNAADSKIIKKEEEGVEEQEHEWEQVEGQETDQKLRARPSVITDDGSLADDSGSSFGDQPRALGVIAAMKARERFAEGDDSSMQAQQGDATDPSERVPETPLPVTGLKAPQMDFTPPITPDSEKFPLPGGLRKSGDEKPTSKLASSPLMPSSPIDQEDKGASFADMLPSRDTVDMAAQYANPSTSTPVVQEADQGGYYRQFGLQPPPSTSNSRRATNIDNIPQVSHPSASTPFSPTSTSPPRTPVTSTTTTVFLTPAIPLQRFSASHSQSTSPVPSPTRRSFRRPLPPPPHSEAFSLWDVAMLPVTIPFAVTRVMVSFSFRAFAFGVVCGVTLVRLGTQSVQHLILGRRV